MSATSLVIPTDIPWAEFKGTALEELLYWLCDAMGAQDLEWRAGAATGTSRDRGRDLEATFHVPEPGGTLRAERWWIQAKGRKDTVPPGAVRDAVVDVYGQGAADVLVIATNTRVSNDTRDWVAEFQRQHPRPSVRLWEQPDLERMLLDHPSVVARVAPDALSLEGQMAAATAAYWNRGQLPSHGQLDRFWESRTKLSFSSDDLLTVIVGEAARDGLLQHPWAAELDVEAVAAALTLGLVNVVAFLSRLERGGHDTEPLRLALVHLIVAGLVRLPAEAVAGLVEDPWQFFENASVPDDETKDKVRRYLIEPIVHRVRTYLGSACMADCERLYGELEREPAGAPEARWYEFLHSGNARPSGYREASPILMEIEDAVCRAGLPLDAEHGCPFGASADVGTWKDLLKAVQPVVHNRLAQAIESHSDHDEDAADERTQDEEA